jgi:hypothetical protein
MINPPRNNTKLIHCNSSGCLLNQRLGNQSDSGSGSSRNLSCERLNKNTTRSTAAINNATDRQNKCCARSIFSVLSENSISNPLSIPSPALRKTSERNERKTSTVKNPFLEDLSDEYRGEHCVIVGRNYSTSKARKQERAGWQRLELQENWSSERDRCRISTGSLQDLYREGMP